MRAGRGQRPDGEAPAESRPVATAPAASRGEAISLTARVLQVVDVFDALTTDRPYRRAFQEVACTFR